MLLALWSFNASEGILYLLVPHLSVVEIFRALPVCLGRRLFKRKAIDVECQEIGRYYRNPDLARQNCYTYYYCLGGTVFEYSCSGGLMFDIRQQICNFEDQVKNCNTTAGTFW